MTNQNDAKLKGILSAVSRLRRHLLILAKCSTDINSSFEDFANPCEELYFGILEPLEVFDYWNEWRHFDKRSQDQLRHVLFHLEQLRCCVTGGDDWSRSAIEHNPKWQSIREAARDILKAAPWLALTEQQEIDDYVMSCFGEV